MSRIRNFLLRDSKDRQAPEPLFWPLLLVYLVLVSKLVFDALSYEFFAIALLVEGLIVLNAGLAVVVFFIKLARKAFKESKADADD